MFYLTIPAFSMNDCDGNGVNSSVNNFDDFGRFIPNDGAEPNWLADDDDKKREILDFPN